MTDRWLTAAQVAERTTLHRSAIYRWAEDGRFPRPVHLPGRRVVWVESEVDQWMHEQRVSDRGQQPA